MTTLPPPAEMYQALLDRDAACDGVFFIAVKTTGIFCRPVCPARKPKPENVEYFGSIREALRAGYRPCKRCRPGLAPDRHPDWVRRLLDEVERDPAARLGDVELLALEIDPARARRYFKRHFGMTYQAYHRARRLGLALNEVRAGADLTNVGLRYGFESTSGFRDAFARLFGEPPGRGRSAGCLLADWLETPLGPMIAVANDEGLCLLEFSDRRALETQAATMRRRLGQAVVPGKNPHLERVADELARYFEGTLTRFTVPLVRAGSEFQLAVWRRLEEVPYGRTACYAEIARAIGRPGANQAVGRANGDNRLAIIIPCHRVIRSDGHLCGYAGGLWRKQWLLDHERRVAAGA